MARVFIRGLLVVAMLLVLAAMAPGKASAATELGQFCVNLAPFPDTIRLSLTQESGAATMITVTFRWRGVGFQIGGTGVITESLTPGSFDLAITGTHNTDSLAGNRMCSLFATLSPPAFSGPWQLICVGGMEDFTSEGTLNFVPCPGTA